MSFSSWKLNCLYMFVTEHERQCVNQLSAQFICVLNWDTEQLTVFNWENHSHSFDLDPAAADDAAAVVPLTRRRKLLETDNWIVRASKSAPISRAPLKRKKISNLTFDACHYPIFESVVETPRSFLMCKFGTNTNHSWENCGEKSEKTTTLLA